MFTKILAAIDDSDMSQYVFDEAVSLAKAIDGSLMFLHVLSSVDEPHIDPLFIQPAILDAELLTETYEKNLSDWEQLKQSRAKWLRCLCDSATSSGVPAKFSMGTGEASRIICDVARDWNADVIVIGRRGRRGLSELFLGSVSNYVMHHALCSVLIVQAAIISATETSQTKDIKTNNKN